MLATLQALKHERIVNIKELQKSPSRSLQGLTRILKGSTTLGYFLSAQDFEDFVEDLQAVRSLSYRRRIARSRRSKKVLSLAQVQKRRI